jgi:hypothetical protein
MSGPLSTRAVLWLGGLAIGMAVGLCAAELRELLAWSIDRALELWHRTLRGIRAARQPVSDIGRDPNHRVILLPRSAGPVVISRDCKYPQPLSRVPIRSEKADAKKKAKAYAEQRAGRPLTWKRARQLLNHWGREDKRAADLALAASMNKSKAASNRQEAAR